MKGVEPYLDILLPLFKRVEAGDLSIIVSAITESELLVRPERESDRAAIEQINNLLSEESIYVIGVDRQIGRRAAALRGRTRLKLADAIIVATALETGCEAVVGNDGDWSREAIGIPFVWLDEVVNR